MRRQLSSVIHCLAVIGFQEISGTSYSLTVYIMLVLGLTAIQISSPAIGQYILVTHQLYFGQALRIYRAQTNFKVKQQAEI